VQQGERRGQQTCRLGRAAPDHQLFMAAVTDPLDVLAGGLQRLLDHLRLGDQRLAGLCWHDPSRGAGQHRQAQGFFKRADAARKRRLRQTQLRGRRGQTAQAAGGEQVAQTEELGIQVLHRRQ